jgi:hypothetical protein
MYCFLQASGLAIPYWLFQGKTQTHAAKQLRKLAANWFEKERIRPCWKAGDLLSGCLKGATGKAGDTSVNETLRYASPRSGQINGRVWISESALDYWAEISPLVTWKFAFKFFYTILRKKFRDAALFRSNCKRGRGIGNDIICYLRSL